MNRQEFLAELRKNLSKLPEEEREAAIEFYDEYISEALDGCEDEEERSKLEQKLIAEAGSPAQIAARIKGEYAARLLDGDDNIGKKEEGPKNSISAVWWVILGIFAAPVSIPIAIVTVCIVVCILIGVVCLVISAFATVIGVAFGGLISAVLAVLSIGSSAPTALMFIGGALVCLSFTAAVGYGTIVGTKALAKAIGRAFARIGEKRRQKKQGGEIQ